jgi:hypothetical protein
MINVKKIFSLGLLSLALLFASSTYCYASIFDTLAENTAGFAVGLRNLAYVISGFGIVMFTFLAIGGKINFKHLGYIVLCLFMLSAVGSIIVYITDGGSDKNGYLKLEGQNYFGTQYTKAGKGEIKGSSSL